MERSKFNKLMKKAKFFIEIRQKPLVKNSIYYDEESAVKSVLSRMKAKGEL